MTAQMIFPQVQAEQPLRVVLVTETWPPEINGVAHTVYQLAAGLRARGHRLCLIRPAQISPPPHALAETELLVRGFRVPKYPQLQGGMPAYGAIREQFKQFKPDVVHLVTEGPLGLAALFAARSLHLPVTSGFHSPFHEFSQFFGLGFLLAPIKAYLRFFHNRTQMTCVPSAKTAKDLTQMGIRQVAVVGRGVNGQQFNPEHRCSVLRATWQANHQSTVMMYVGRLSPEKNIDLVVNAFREFRLSQPMRDVKLVLVGDGPDRTRLEKLAPDAIFAGMQTGQALSEHYASADVFCFASQVETFGNVVLEAMSSGLPVLAFNDACAAQVVETDKTGWLVALRDDISFCQYAGQLPNVVRLKEMGLYARLRVMNMGWQTPVSELEQAFASAQSCLTDQQGKSTERDILQQERSVHLLRES